MYESPIRLLVQEIETHMREQHDKQIFEAIQKFGVDVDRDELIKALSYDRDQYDKGYADGRADAQRWISVEERLPEANTLVIVGGNGKVTSGIYHGKYGLWTTHGEIDFDYWMPLPEPPKED